MGKKAKDAKEPWMNRELSLPSQCETGGSGDQRRGAPGERPENASLSTGTTAGEAQPRVLEALTTEAAFSYVPGDCSRAATS